MNLCSLSFWLNSLSCESKKIAQKKRFMVVSCAEYSNPYFHFDSCVTFFISVGGILHTRASKFHEDTGQRRGGTHIAGQWLNVISAIIVIYIY